MNNSHFNGRRPYLGCKRLLLLGKQLVPGCGGCALLLELVLKLSKLSIGQREAALQLEYLSLQLQHDAMMSCAHMSSCPS